jgi:hypothetical protein
MRSERDFWFCFVTVAVHSLCQCENCDLSLWEVNLTYNSCILLLSATLLYPLARNILQHLTNLSCPFSPNLLCNTRFLPAFSPAYEQRAS